MLRGASRTHILTLAHQSFTQARLILQKIHPSRSFVEMAPDHSASARQTFLSQKKSLEFAHMRSSMLANKGKLSIV